MNIFKKLGFKVSSAKEDIYEECNKLNLSKNETESIYNYYKKHYEDTKVLLDVDEIVRIIIIKLNIVSP